MNKYLQSKKYIDWLKNKFIGQASTYSQTGEDLILNIFLKDKKGFYVDIGANHPTKFNNTKLFYNQGWSGINIEPNPYKIKGFYKKRKRDINLNIGINSQKGTLEFYLFKEDTLSTFSQSTSKKYEDMGHKIIGTKKINTLRLSDVLNQYTKPDTDIDFFSIDTEGLDYEVLESNDWNLYRPKFIIIETLEYSISGDGKKLNYLYDKYFEEKRYIKVADTYINTIYKRL